MKNLTKLTISVITIGTSSLFAMDNMKELKVSNQIIEKDIKSVGNDKEINLSEKSLDSIIKNMKKRQVELRIKKEKELEKNLESISKNNLKPISQKKLEPISKNNLKPISQKKLELISPNNLKTYF